MFSINLVFLFSYLFKSGNICDTEDNLSWKDVIYKEIHISDKCMIAKVLCKRQDYAAKMKELTKLRSMPRRGRGKSDLNYKRILLR